MDEYTFQDLPQDIVFQLLADIINAKGSPKRAAASTPAAVLKPPAGEGTASDSLGATEADATGKMSKEASSTLGALSTARSIAATTLGLLGMGVPALGPLGWGFTMMNIANKYADPYETNPIGGAPTPESIEAARDISGMFAANDLAAQRDQAIADALAMDETGWTAGMLSQLEGMGKMAGGWEGTTQGFGSTTLGGAVGSRTTAGDYGRTTTAEPGLTNPDSPFGNAQQGGYGGIGSSSGNAGASSGAEGGTTGAGGRDGEGGTGEGRGGDTDWRGGVRIGTPSRPQRTVFGKRGREEAIFIPDRFMLPGQQPRETMVENALRRKLRQLLDDRRARSTR